LGEFAPCWFSLSQPNRFASKQWALGVITYEFLYGTPPFHAPTPQEVFENILARNIDWQEDETDVSPEARDFMERLMCTKVEDRLGNMGSAEVKAHPWFADVNWSTLFSHEASFIPKPAGVEDTFYFDDRGAAGKKLSEVEEHTDGQPSTAASAPAAVETVSKQEAAGTETARELVPFDAGDEGAADFGAFAFKNLQLLEKANTDTMEKLRSEMLLSGVSPQKGRRRTLTSSSIRLTGRSRTLSFNSGDLPAVLGRTTLRSATDNNLQDLSFERDDVTSNTGGSSSPSPRLATGTPPPSRSRSRQPRERRGSVATTSSGGTANEWKIRGGGATLHDPEGRISPERTPRPKALARSHTTKKILTPFDRTFNILVAEDNIISAKILEAQLNRLGGLCVFVSNGAEAVHAASSDVKFDIIFLDIVMPISGLLLAAVAVALAKLRAFFHQQCKATKPHTSSNPYKEPTKAPRSSA
jgi:serine/threonine-protein kinase RIM15